MQVRDVMTRDPVCCTRDTSLTDVARLMVDHNCGAVPVVESYSTNKLIGIITDRDIVCRSLADGKDPFQMVAGDCLSAPVVSIQPDAGLTECAELMKEHQLRRIPVMDGNGSCCGMVAQADLAQHAPDEQAAEVLQRISEPALAAAH